MRTRHTVAALCTLAACTASLTTDAQLTGITWDGEMVALYTDGQGNVIGDTGSTEFNSLTRMADGSILAASYGSPADLITIDPWTGAGTFFTHSGLSDIRAIAGSPEGWLYLIHKAGAQSELWVYDFSPGGGLFHKTLIGDTSLVGVQGMEFSPGGELYAWSTSYGLMVIDRFTAVCTDVNPAVGGSSDIQTLDFAPDGTLYGAYEQLYTIDTTTGVPTPVGGGSYASVRGIVYDPASAPTLFAPSDLAPGATLDLDLAGQPGAGYAVGLALDSGPICPGALPFCLDLGPTGASVVLLPIGALSASGAASLSLPTPADPLLSGLELHWQAVTFTTGYGPRKTPAVTTVFL